MSLKKSDARVRMILWSLKSTLSEEQRRISAVGSENGCPASEGIAKDGEWRVKSEDHPLLEGLVVILTLYWD